MRQILVFRCASHDVMKKLFKELKLKDVVCLVQESCLEQYKEMYPEMKVLSIKQNYFNYNDFRRLGIEFESFQKIYIPSSMQTFSGFEEIFNIVDSLKYKELILYDCNGNKYVTNNSKIANMLETLTGTAAVIYSKIYSIYYEIVRKFNIL